MERVIIMAHEHAREGDTDYITRDTLELHCGHIHEPLLKSLDDTRKWVGSLDARMWLMVIGLLGIFLTSAAGIVVSLSTRSAVTTESRRSMRYERQQNPEIAGTEVK
jgi:hypothetical protein